MIRKESGQPMWNHGKNFGFSSELRWEASGGLENSPGVWGWKREAGAGAANCNHQENAGGTSVIRLGKAEPRRHTHLPRRPQGNGKVGGGDGR